MNPITVVLAEDHQIIREGLRSMLGGSEDFKIIGEAENGLQAVALAARLCPDVVVMDITMPFLDGLSATRQILQNSASIKVLILTGHADTAFIEQAREIGASGYLTKQTATVLPEAIRAVCKGVPFFSPGHSSLKIS
jgi:DNA-binding NarL/FixJ family response regulator